MAQTSCPARGAAYPVRAPRGSGTGSTMHRRCGPMIVERKLGPGSAVHRKMRRTASGTRWRDEVSHCSLPAAICDLQPEPGHHDRGEQERDHGARDRGALAQLPGMIARWYDKVAIRWVALTGRRRHRPDQLEVVKVNSTENSSPPR